MKKHITRLTIVALCAALSLAACKPEDVLHKIEKILQNPAPTAAPMDPSVAAVFSGQKALEISRGQNADYFGISFPRRFWGANIMVKSALFLPPGKKHVPVMMIFHGSGGLKQHELDYAREFLAMGVGAMVVDSFGPRGVTTTFQHQGSVAPRSLALDATTALTFLALNPRVDIDNVGIIGFSKGGIAAHYTALASINAIPPLKKRHRFKMHIAAYPGCAAHSYDLTTTGAPIYMLLGEKDTAVGIQNCQLYAKRLKGAGANVFVKVYPGAHHGWDADTAVPDPAAENYTNCLFEQQPDKTWTEKTSGMTGIVDLEGDKYEEAVKRCVTRGMDKKYDPAIAKESLNDIKALVQKDLLPTQPLLVPKAEPPPAIPEKPKPEPKKKRHKR